jgi:hypothetical protein
MHIQFLFKKNHHPLRKIYQIASEFINRLASHFKLLGLKFFF